MAALARRPCSGAMLSALWHGSLALALLDSAVSFMVPAPVFRGVVAPSRGPSAARGAFCALPGPARSARLGVLQLRAAAAPAKPRGYWHEWANVEAEIRQYIAEHGDGSGGMPATSQLRKHGLTSLADAISRFGGVQKVAGRLGLACGKPKGYWQDYANTRVEFEAFLACWRAAANQPNGVPTQEMMRAAGRHDLIAALQLHGGMQRLAQDLDLTFYNVRRSGEGSMSGVSSGRHKIFQGRLWSFIAINGTNGYMPSTEVLRNFACDKLADDVERLGGAVLLAKRFGLRPQRRPNGLDLIQDAIVSFVKTSGAPGVLPGKEELAEAGRLDLDAKLEEIGRERVCKYMGLYMSEHAKLQAVCDTEEALTSPSFVALAVEAQKPTLKRGAVDGFVRSVPLFKGDTRFEAFHARTVSDAAQRKARASAYTEDLKRQMLEKKRHEAAAAEEASEPAKHPARTNTIRVVARNAAAAVNAAVDGASGGDGISLEAMKQSFRRRLASSASSDQELRSHVKV